MNHREREEVGVHLQEEGKRNPVRLHRQGDGTGGFGNSADGESEGSGREQGSPSG